MNNKIKRKIRRKLFRRENLIPMQSWLVAYNRVCIWRHPVDLMICWVGPLRRTLLSDMANENLGRC